MSATECQASPCDLIRASNAERDRICTIIANHLCAAYPDRAVAIIDAIHATTEVPPAGPSYYETHSILMKAVVTWAQMMPLVSHAGRIRQTDSMLALELMELNRRVVAFEAHEGKAP